MFEFDDPRFRPLWTRVLIAGSCLAWAAFEVFMGSIGWAMLFGALGLWASFRFFVTYNPDNNKSE